MAYSPIAVANHFLDLAVTESAVDMTPMMVQKIVYFAHGWHWAIADKPLINEQIEAWDYGPVIRSLYNRLREYGNQIIPSRIGIHDVDFTIKPWKISYSEPSIDSEATDSPDSVAYSKTIINATWNEYKRFTAIQLSNMTHLPDTPWEITVRKAKEENGGILPNGTDIPATTIKEWFRSLMEGNRVERREAAGV